MSARKDYCVSCKTPILDETIKGDLTQSSLSVVHPAKGIDGITNKDLTNMVTGSNSGCRNCFMVLDALSLISKSKDQEEFTFVIVPERKTRTLLIKCDAELEFCDSRYSYELSHMEVFRQSGLSN